MNEIESRLAALEARVQALEEEEVESPGQPERWAEHFRRQADNEAQTRLSGRIRQLERNT